MPTDPLRAALEQNSEFIDGGYGATPPPPLDSLDAAWAETEAVTAKWATGARFQSTQLTVFRALSDEGGPIRYVANAERFLHRHARRAGAVVQP